MNTDHLARLYDQLTPRERVPLIMAAHVRGDPAEQKRLSASAPQLTFQVPDYYPLAKALAHAVHFHLLTLLDLAGAFWQWWGLWLTCQQRPAVDDNLTRGRRRGAAVGTKAGRRGRADADFIKEYRAGSVTRYYASRFVAHADGWKQFCAELHVDPEAPLKVMIGWSLVTQTEKAARRLAFSAAEAAQFQRLETVAVEGVDAQQRSPVSIESVADLVRDWHVFLDDLVRREGGRNCASMG
jgi:hypothetical protein